MKKQLLIISCFLCVGVVVIAGSSLVHAECIEADEVPIKICYELESDANHALKLLEFSEEVWEFFIINMGFEAPSRVNDAGEIEVGMLIQIDDLQGGAGYAEPTADIPDTPHSDCATRIWVDRTMPVDYLPVLSAHELGHSIQNADDCAEVMHEFFAPYFELLFVERTDHISPEDYIISMNDLFFEAFQKHPGHSLDFLGYFDPNLRYYHYGSSLFAAFIDQRYGDGEGTILAEISFHTRQDGTILIDEWRTSLESGENEPDIFDAIDEVLIGRGASLFDAVAEFSVWRLFTGSLDDGLHLKYAEYYHGIKYDTSFEFSDLPIQNAYPEIQTMETGTSYIDLVLGDDISPGDFLTFEFGDEYAQYWYLAAIKFGAESNELVDKETIGGGGSFEIRDLEGVEHVVFVISNLGNKQRDPDETETMTYNFTYSITLHKQPRIESVTPATVKQGDQGVVITVTGAAFGEELEIDFGQGIEIIDQQIQETSLELTIDVANNAPLGWRALVMNFPDEPETRMEQALEVELKDAPVITSISPVSAFTGDILRIAIGGKNFQDGTTVTMGEGIIVNSVEYVDSTSLNADIQIEEDALVGPRDLQVTSPDGQVYTLSGSFMVEKKATSANGCGCRLSKTSTAPLTPLFLFLMLFLPLLSLSRRRT